MKINGLIFILFVGFTSAKSEALFKYHYLRLANGGCVKCVFATKIFNQIKDEFKPFIVFNQKERSTYRSDLIANGLENWPEEKMLFVDTLAQQMPADTFGILYATNDHVNYQQIQLNMVFNPAWLNIWYLQLKADTFSIPNHLNLSKSGDYYVSQNKRLIHNPQTKTIYEITRQKTVELQLTDALKFNIISPYLTDTHEVNTYKRGVELIKSIRMDQSEFCSLAMTGDTLVALVNIGYVLFSTKKNRLVRSQFLCKFLDGKLINSHKLKESKKHVTYDELGAYGLFYRNDSMYLRCNFYNKKDLMTKTNHLTLFTLKNNYYTPSKVYNLEVPEHILNQSQGSRDYTGGSFFEQAKQPDFYFFCQPALYQKHTNILLPIDAFKKQNDTAFTLTVMNYYDFTVLLTSFESSTNTQQLHFKYQNQLIQREISVSTNNNLMKFNGKGISVLDVENRKIIDVGFVPSKFLKVQ